MKPETVVHHGNRREMKGVRACVIRLPHAWCGRRSRDVPAHGYIGDVTDSVVRGIHYEKRNGPEAAGAASGPE